ncbi:MAG: GNAT family N-acetyltransferase [Tabrizicola sp.]|jgi:diamine N-acetyltransferase|nr:GNAT family N-acetyltransferase [Tabrizicola sp.]
MKKGSTMISLRPVTRKNLDALFNMSVHPDQQDFVSPNPKTLAQLPLVPGGYLFAIYRDEDVAGLLALIDFREHDEFFDGDDRNAAFLMRLMVGADFQGQGVGRAALAQAIDWARTRGNSAFQTSIVPGNTAARRLYAAHGLCETGRMIEGEVEMALAL